MRLLFIPNFTKRVSKGGSLLTDSAYKLLYDARIELGEEAYAYWILPDSVKECKTELNEKNNAVFYEKPRLDNFDLRENYVDNDLVLNFSRRFGDYFVDAIVTTRRGAIVEMSKLTDMVRFADEADNTHDKRKVNIPIIFIEPNTWKYESLIDVLEALGYYFSYPIFLTETEKRKALKNASQFLSGASLRVIDDKAIIGSSYFDFDKMDEIKKKAVKSHEVVNLFYGQRINKYKRSKLIFEVYAKLYSIYGEKKVNVIGTTITGSFGIEKKIGQDYWGKFFRLLTNCNWTDYINYANVSHVGLITSESEALSSSHVEQLYMGVILVMPKVGWARELVPKDYPFLYSSISEAYTILHYIIENYEEAYKKFEPTIKHIRDKFSQKDKTIPLVIKNIVEVYRNSLMLINESNTVGKMGLMSRSLGLTNPIKWENFVKNIDKYSANMKSPQSENLRRMNMLSDYEMYLTLLMKMGYRDTLDTIMPQLEYTKGEVDYEG